MDNTENSGKRVAIQGYSGCFHEQAARIFYGKYDGSTPVSVECPTFDDLYRSLDTGRADAAIMAIENTVSGGLLPNFELLRKYNVKIKGEVFLRIQQNLMALPGQKIEDIKEVRTHYMAINQTRPFFQSYPWIRLVESVLRAQSRALDMIAEGVDGADVHSAVVDSFEADGFKTKFSRGHWGGFFHSTGHGLGLEVHEGPSLGTRRCILESGNVVTVEPGLYYREIGGCRIEDNVLVEQGGARMLSKYHYNWVIE